MAPAQYPPVPFRYRWVSRAVMPERRGQRCRIVSYQLPGPGSPAVAWVMASEADRRRVRVCFEDGTEHLVERHHIRLRARGDIWRKCKASSCRCPVGRDGSHGMCGKHAARDRRSRRDG